MTNQEAVAVGSLAQVPGTPPTMVIYDHAAASLSTAWVLGAMESITITGNASEAMTQNYEGNIVAVHWSGEYFEAGFRIRPIGTSAANAKASAHILRFGYTAVTTGLPIIAASPFADILNVTSGDPGANRWIYVGSTMELSNSAPAGRTLTFRRFPKIVGSSAVITS